MNKVMELVTVFTVFAIPGVIILVLGLLFKRRSVVIIGGVMIVLLVFLGVSNMMWGSEATLEQVTPVRGPLPNTSTT